MPARSSAPPLPARCPEPEDKEAFHLARPFLRARLSYSRLSPLENRPKVAEKHISHDLLVPPAGDGPVPQTKQRVRKNPDRLPGSLNIPEKAAVAESCPLMGQKVGCGHCPHPVRGCLMTIGHSVFVGGRSCGRMPSFLEVRRFSAVLLLHGPLLSEAT